MKILSLCLVLSVVFTCLGDGLGSQQIPLDPLAKTDEPDLSHPSVAAAASSPEEVYTVKTGMVLSPILRSCMEEAVRLCHGVVDVIAKTADPAQPCPFPWMPFERCEVNLCLVLHSNLEQARKEHPELDFLPASTDISDECKNTVQEAVMTNEFQRILENGPANLYERLVLLEIQGNALALVLSQFVFGIGMFCWAIMVSTMVYRTCCKKKEMTWKEERQAVLEAVANSEDYKERLETLTGEELDPSPFEFKWTPAGQVPQISKMRNQTKVLRAIYSTPLLKCQIQEDLLADSEVILGFTPPVDQNTLDRVFGKPKTFLQQWLPVLDLGLVLFIATESFGQLHPWLFLLISVYFVWRMVIIKVLIMLRYKHTRKSTCCVCGTTSIQASICSKKTEDPGVCDCCAGTGVCSVACEICISRLEKKFPPLEVPPQLPLPATTAVQHPLPKQHGRLL